jgi:hypothetical protein
VYHSTTLAVGFLGVLKALIWASFEAGSYAHLCTYICFSFATLVHSQLAQVGFINLIASCLLTIRTQNPASFSAHALDVQIQLLRLYLLVAKETPHPE